MAKISELQGRDDGPADRPLPHLAIEIDRDAAYRLGLSLAAIDNTLYDAFGQRQVGVIYTSTSQYWVILEVQRNTRPTRTALSHIYVSGTGGSQVPLSTFAHYTTKIEPLTVNHRASSRR